jgi:homoserine O-acetyltransferase
MKSLTQPLKMFCASLLWAAAFVLPAAAADYPTPVEADWTARDFRFHTGEVMPEMRIHYRTVGNPNGEPVLVLHGTAGSGASMLNATFAQRLFGPGQALDARRYFIILPDAIGAGKSTRPSDGLRAKFPQYNYADIVQAHHRLLTEGLGIKHLRLIIGNSMGGMHTWLWGTTHPEFADVLVPMASQPAEMSGRNWAMRRLLIESIRQDPEWQGGNYTAQPRSLRFMNVFFGFGTNGGNQALYKAGPNSAAVDKVVETQLAAPMAADANDYIYQWESSRDYKPTGLERVRSAVLAINSADDERNPPELGIMERELPRMPNAKLLLIPGSPETRGHGTTMLARYYEQELKALLETAPRLAR